MTKVKQAQQRTQYENSVEVIQKQALQISLCSKKVILLYNRGFFQKTDFIHHGINFNSCKIMTTAVGILSSGDIACQMPNSAVKYEDHSMSVETNVYTLNGLSDSYTLLANFQYNLQYLCACDIFLVAS